MSKALAEHIYLEMVKLFKKDPSIDMLDTNYTFPNRLTGLIHNLDQEEAGSTKQELQKILYQDLRGEYCQLQFKTHIDTRNKLNRKWFDYSKAYNKAYFQTAAENDIFKCFISIGVLLIIIPYLWIPEELSISWLGNADIKFMPGILLLGCACSSLLRYQKLRKKVEPLRAETDKMVDHFEQCCEKSVLEITDHYFNAQHKDDAVDEVTGGDPTHTQESCQKLHR